MVFNSIQFAIFFPLVFCIYWAWLYKNLMARNLFLFVVSSIFYGTWDWRFLILLYTSATIDFATAFYIDKTGDVARKKWLVGVTIFSNLSILGVFKYFNFFNESFVLLLQGLGFKASPWALNIVLPVGISFYTFQSIAYVIDVYRKRVSPCTNYIEFMAFVSFFPQLVAGPIERARHMLPQFRNVHAFRYQYAVTGLRLILYGLFKKVAIADNISMFVDVVYGAPHQYYGMVTICATLLFALQIYCDFSGYSNIAIGCARLLGFNLMKNFDTPYFAQSLKEFWQRWHISLSTWFRDYLYIPMGGNKVSTPRKYFNLFITFLVSGLWHGANFTFVIWGAMHGVCLVVEDYIKQHTRIGLPSIFKHALTLLVVCYAWVFFRAATIADAWYITNSFFKPSTWAQLQQVWLGIYYSLGFTCLLLGSMAVFAISEVLIARGTLSNIPAPVRIAFYYLLIVAIAIVGLNDNSPNFIYFKF